MSYFQQLLINDSTKKQLEKIVKQPPQALILLGSAGSGKTAIAEALSATLLGTPDVAALYRHPYFEKLLKPAKKKDISVDSVRGLIKQASLKTPGLAKVRRIVVIENAGDLSLPAQNALLKTLEEPPADLVFILTVEALSNILPTITSRAVPLTITPVNLGTANRFFGKDYGDKDIEKAWLISAGRAGLLHNLLKADHKHPLIDSINQAKKLIQQGPVDSLAVLEASDTEDFGRLLDALDLVLASLHHSAIAKNRSVQAKALLSRRQLLRQLKSNLGNNANDRLIKLELALNLKL